MTSIAIKEAILHPKKLWDPLSRLLENLRKPLERKETMSAVIPKPNLRGFLRRETYRTMAVASAISSFFCVAWQVWFVKPRQSAEKEFFKNYDPDKGYPKERREQDIKECENLLRKKLAEMNN